MGFSLGDTRQPQTIFAFGFLDGWHAAGRVNGWQTSLELFMAARGTRRPLSSQGGLERHASH